MQHVTEAVYPGVYQRDGENHVIVSSVGSHDETGERWVAYEDKGKTLFCPEESFIERGFVPLRRVRTGKLTAKDLLEAKTKKPLAWLWGVKGG